MALAALYCHHAKTIRFRGKLFCCNTQEIEEAHMEFAFREPLLWNEKRNTVLSFFFFLIKQSEDPTKMYLVTNHECIAARFCTYRKHGRPDSWGSHFYQQTRDGWLVWSSSDDTSVSVTSFPPTHPSLCQWVVMVKPLWMPCFLPLSLCLTSNFHSLSSVILSHSLSDLHMCTMSSVIWLWHPMKRVAVSRDRK